MVTLTWPESLEKTSRIMNYIAEWIEGKEI